VEFQTVINHRRMVRHYDTARPVPQGVLERVVRNGLRAPSAGFSQGTGFLVLDTPPDVARFRTGATPVQDPENWFAAQVDAPVVIVVLSNKDTYLDRYAQPDKGFTDRSDAWWTAPYWDIDAGMAALLVLLTAVDESLGACFFGIPIDRVTSLKETFGIPESFYPIGAISLGYSSEQPRDLKDRRRPAEDMVRYGRWSR
jgi:nitroreductase